MTIANKILMLFVGLFLLASCAQEAEKKEKKERVVDPATLTKIEFEEEDYDFGSVSAGEKVTHIFKFKNTGDKPLTIFEASASCGCTVPEYPKEPIAPGEGGEIKVVFNSTGKEGQQNKHVFVESNTDPVKSHLTIKGMVNK